MTEQREIQVRTDSTVNPEGTVNEMIARIPKAAGVFNHFGIDTCCGGNIAIVDAARIEGIDLRELTEALRRVVIA